MVSRSVALRRSHAVEESPLRQLVKVLSDEMASLAAHLDAMYEDAFVGTSGDAMATIARRLVLDRARGLQRAVRASQRLASAEGDELLVEALASVGDALSTFQEAVAAEAYLATGRHRASIRKHARLLQDHADAPRGRPKPRRRPED